MKKLRTFFALLSLMLVVGVHTLLADDWDKTTKVTFSESVQVPGKVLPAGTYVFKLLNSSSDRHIVQIFNEDHTSLITTVMAIPNQRLEPAGKTILTYQERPSDQPMALNAWFYPGDNFGQQFIYPKAEAQELSRLNKMEVPSTEAEAPYTGEPEKHEEVAHNSAPASAPAPQPELKAENTPPPAPNPPAVSEPAPQAHAAPTPAPRQKPEHLPKTASSLPLFGLVGFLLLGFAAILRKALRA